MGTRDPRVDAYIAKQKDFAKPVLVHLRDVVHAVCPDVEETIKWSTPFFVYHGAVLCRMAGFKEHAVFGFWKSSLIDGLGANGANGGDAAGNMGRLTSIRDLPGKKQLTAFIKAAMTLHEGGIAVARPKGARKAEPTIPPELADALARNTQAAAAFDKFPPSHRRAYVDWITEAKREATRAKRVAQAVAWLAEGKSRNWKYEDR